MASPVVSPYEGATCISSASSMAASAPPLHVAKSRQGMQKYHAPVRQTRQSTRISAESIPGKGPRTHSGEAVLASNSNEDPASCPEFRGIAHGARTANGARGGMSRRQLLLPAVIAAVFSPCSAGWGAGENVPLDAQEVREVTGLASPRDGSDSASGNVVAEYERRLTAPDQREESEDEDEANSEKKINSHDVRVGTTQPPLASDIRGETTQLPLASVEPFIPEPPPSIFPLATEPIPSAPSVPEMDLPMPVLPTVREQPTAISILIQDLKFFARDLAFGAIAGGVGAGVVYPVDFVKTRMQAQREPLHASGVPVQAPKYRNGWDCFATVVREDGFLALYDGLLPQMVGVAPEKAIKLSVNSFLRRTFVEITDVPRDSLLPVNLAFLAGGISGLAQIVVANPLEMVKVRLQMQGRVIQLAEERLRAAMATAAAANAEGATVASVPTEGPGDPGSAQLVLVKESSAPVVAVVLPTIPKRQSAMDVIHELGFAGLYRASGATMMRDCVFNGLYFSVYGVLRDAPWATAWGIWGTVLAGTLAGVPAAYLATPMDVVKTRLQICDKSLGEKPYNGIFDCYAKIIEEEGWVTLFKGGGFRVLRSAPQFGVTLAVFEVLFKIFE